MTRPKRIAIVNGKRVLVDYASRQEECQAYNKDRWKYQKEIKQFYNSKAWRELSRLVLNESLYVCRRCGGDATLTDHIVPIKVDWSFRLTKDNLQPLCDACHAVKTGEDARMYK